MAISILQHNQIPATASPAGISFNSVVTAGSTLICGIRTNSGTDLITSVKDNVNNVEWTLVKSQVQTTDGHFLYLYYFKNTAAGTPTLTVTAAGLAIRIIVAEVGGADTSAPLDGAGVSQQQNSTTAPATPNLTTSNAADLIIALLGAGNGGAYTENASGSNPSSGWTQVDDSNAGKLHMSSVVVAATGTYHETWTATSDNFSTIGAAFTAAAGDTLSGSQLVFFI